MVAAYAVVLVVGVVALVAWILTRSLRPGGPWDPEQRFGIAGRRVVAALVGFGMAGMSAEFSPRDLPWPAALALAAAGAVAAAWYAGTVGAGDAGNAGA